MEDPKVSTWLAGLGLEHYAQAFAEAEVDFDTLPELTAADLLEIGVQAVGPRRRLESAIARLRAEQATATEGPVFIGARRHLTILFCDVVGSTALSQRFDAEQMSEMFRDYYAVVTRVLQRRGGHEANRLGDGSFIFFGYPQAREHAALQAVLTAREILDETHRLVRDPGGEPIRVRAGLASGMVVLNHADTTNVFGETANVAARIQALAEAGEVVIADSTRRLIRDQVRVESRGRHTLKGIDAEMQVWRVLGDETLAAPGSGSSALLPPVGRERELATLDALWRELPGGAGRCVYVSGEAGIGKSHLVAAFAQRVRAAGHPLHSFGCSSEFVDSPFFPFLREARGARRGTDLVDPLLTAALREPERNESLYLIRRRRESLISGFVRRALAPGDGTPTLICFEDAHWSDPSSLEVLARLGQAIAQRPVLLVITGRDPDGIPGISPDAVLTLGPLSAAAVEQIVASTIAAHALSPLAGVIAEIAERADGMPLFAAELALSFAQASAAHPETGPAISDVPASLQEALQYRVDGLAVGSELLELAAIFGREVPMDVLGALIPSERVRAAALNELGAAGLLNVSYADGADLSETVSFRHQLVLEYVYDTILRERRAALHARVADVLEQRPESAPETRAYHEERAGRGERAAYSWAQAGRLAASRSADAEASAYFRRALALLPQFSDAEAAEAFEVDVLLAFLPALIGSDGYVSAATASVNRVVELTTRRAQPEQGFNAMFLRWLDQMGRGGIDIAHSLGLELAPLAEQLGSDAALLLIDRMLGSTHLFRGELEAAHAALERFARRYDPDRHAAALAQYGATDNYTTVQCCRICVAVLTGQPEQARRLQETTVAAAERLGRVHNHCHVLAYGGAIGAALQSDWGAMSLYVRELRELAAPHALPFWEATVKLFEGIELTQQGELARGRQSFDAGVEWFTSNGSGFLLPSFRVLRASAAADSGASDTGEDPPTLRRLLAALSAGERWVRSELLRLLAIEESRLGERHSAVETLELALELARGQGATLMAQRASATFQAIFPEC